ncbi:hypothetical protein HNQ93_002681 [Hymenobacter luteus]|uniref:Uncharacterized protein n=2 Tax=Hymenobacter TaxID=89966 RepID=A0A7W9T1E5_9BACT|nr:MULTISPECIES: hypothetical protein [Hymenobacter]MBB4601750.1 hypothetical protein [Hymenobacter latericoloratus]MBB6059821.1 hypothetical protein [Hymenobacter luteus]
MHTADYWRSLKFDYLTTYSLLRGPKWQHLLAAMRQEKDTSRRALLTATPAELPELRERLRRIERQNDLQTRLTTNANRAYHITATPTATLNRGSLEVEELGRILQTPCQDLRYMMCAPVFRDALAFYNAEHELVGVLNICFGCNVMQTESGQDVEADYRVYEQLRKWFQRLGHQIEVAAYEERPG